MRGIIGLVLYLSSLMGYVMAVNWITADMAVMAPDAKAGIIFVGLIWMALTAMIFELHEINQGLRADFTDALLKNKE
jgi:hypothetical protein